MNHKSFLIISIFLTCLMLITLGRFGGRIRADELPIPEYHPRDDLSGNPHCTACHEGDTVIRKPIGSFDHNRSWYAIHQFSGSYAGRLCRSCHKVSFCTECHAAKDELKPSLKQSGKPERHLPHRGNYLIRHKIDGRIDPVSCYRCHGRRNNRQCRECHKNVK